MTAEPEGAAPISTDPPHQDVQHPEIPYEPPAVAVAETITPPKRGWGPRATFLTVFSVVSVIYVATFVRVAMARNPHRTTSHRSGRRECSPRCDFQFKAKRGTELEPGERGTTTTKGGASAY